MRGFLFGSVAATGAPGQGSATAEIFLAACPIAIFFIVLIKVITPYISNTHYMHLLQVIGFKKKKRRKKTNCFLLAAPTN